MNIEYLTTSVLFWLSFAFSPGPFWISWMNVHAQQKSYLTPFKSYLPFLLVGFPTQCFLLSIVVHYFGSLNDLFVLPLYFIGGLFICFLAWQTLYSTKKKIAIQFNFVRMLILSLSNPKVYLTIPAGALSAHYFSGQILLNVFIFSFVLLIPINFCGSILFALLGKFSQKTSVRTISYFSAGLLVLYGIYLLYEGSKLLYLRL